jgi:uncharacterized SAM-binding protein YcdF (DUF218 family)
MRARFGRDLFLRGRGTDVGVRAPDVVVRLAGATLAFALVLIAESLGIVSVLGVNTPMLRLIAAVTGAFVATTRIGGMLWPLTGLLVALHFLVSFTPLVRPMVPVFVRSDGPRVDAQAVVVMSGGMNDEGRLQKQALHRLLSGLQIVRSRGIPSLALSNTKQVRKQRVLTTEQDQRDLVQLGAPSVDLRFVHDVYSTRDEALAFAALARTHGWRTVVVVTSPLHSARACASLENAGLTVECRPAESRDYSLDRLDLAENRRLVFADVLYESAAWLLYRQRGWN